MLCAYSLWDMTTFTLDVSESQIIWNGVWLGFGLGLVFPPLTTLTFATLPARLRTEGPPSTPCCAISARRSALPCWCRCWRNSQENRAELVEPVHAVQRRLAVRQGMPGADLQMLAVWDAEINRQAAMIGYLNDFRAMTICVLVTIPLLFFMRKQMLMR